MKAFRFNPPVAQSVLNLRNTPDFVRLVDFIRNSQAEIDKELRRTTPEHVAILQGKAQILETLLEEIDTVHLKLN
jgi:hypothetical protein